MSEATGPRAAMDRRFWAAVVDGLVLLVPSLVIGRLLGTAGIVANVVLGLAYATWFESRPAGQTPGKRALGIRVIAFEDGGPLDVRRALVRASVEYIGAVALLLGLLRAFVDPERQGWHDVAAHTVVVPTSAYPVPDAS